MCDASEHDHVNYVTVCYFVANIEYGHPWMLWLTLRTGLVAAISLNESRFDPHPPLRKPLLLSIALYPSLNMSSTASISSSSSASSLSSISDKNAKRLEKLLAKEAKREQKLLDHVLKDVRAAEKTLRKVSKVRHALSSARPPALAHDELRLVGRG